MEYEVNKVLEVLRRNSVLETGESKTTKSIYFYWRNWSFRYSDHKTTSEKHGQYNIIYWYKPLGFMFKAPGIEVYSWFCERDMVAILNRIYKKDKPKNEKNAQKRRMKNITQKIKKARKEKKYKKNWEEEDN